MPYREDSDQERLLAGDPEVLGRVSRWVAEVITAPKYWMLRAEWQDLHQETLARTIDSLRQQRFDACRELRPYVQGIARHAASERLRAHLRMPLGDAPAGPITRSDAEKTVILTQLVRRVLDRASEECRELLLAYFVDQRTYAEIATEQEAPIGTIKSRLSRCLETAHRTVERMRRSSPRRAAR